MPYRIELAPRAEKQIRGLSRQVQERIREAIDALGTDPRPTGCRQLSGLPRIYRIRVGDYRVIYSVQDDVLLILILKVGHRRDIYR